jgi:GTP-binding protein EngB required for normal cell division
VNVPAQESDRQLVEFLRSAGRPFRIVATKSDKLSSNQLQNTLRKLRQEFPETSILPFSARSSAGRDELWQQIRAAIEPQGSVHPHPHS